MSPEGDQVGERPDIFHRHFHIHWEHKETLDWECFHTYREATAGAAELAGPKEVFTIEEVSANCPLRDALHERVGLRRPGSESSR
jgi:hypothetical protein